MLQLNNNKIIKITLNGISTLEYSMSNIYPFCARFGIDISIFIGDSLIVINKIFQDSLKKNK